MSTWPDLTATWDAGTFDKDAGEVIPRPMSITQVGPLITLNDDGKERRGLIGEARARSYRVEVRFPEGSSWFCLGERRFVEAAEEVVLWTPTPAPVRPGRAYALVRAAAAAYAVYDAGEPAVPAEPPPLGAEHEVAVGAGRRGWEVSLGDPERGVRWRVEVHEVQREAVLWSVARTPAMRPYVYLSARADGVLTLRLSLPVALHEAAIAAVEEALSAELPGAPWLPGDPPAS